ncbi:hypothetical protein [Stenotrophomonas sp.]|uniref:hypothetical protein n=1 Tax=Stenotrophomonas sp. TaxID=69392 RepID=UPI00289B713A|nr:hypothetical protein [Stenotrophomonas sp.]
MLSESEVVRHLTDAGIPVSGTAVRDSETAGSFQVFVEFERDQRGRQIPSNAQLDSARASLFDLGVSVDFILTDALMRDAEAGLRASLLHSFGSIVRNSFLAKDGRDAYVWIVPKRQITAEEVVGITAKSRALLAEMGLNLSNMALTTGQNLPSKTRCLSMLRLVAPVTSDALAGHLREAGFVVPSADWMVRRLDGLRKAGQVVRLRSGLYTLTLQALKGLGTVKGRCSPDVARMLALASHRG